MDRAARRGYSGTGPGAITPDGCAVEVYERLPVLDEPDVIEGAVPAGAAVLELGSGTGRITHPLVRRGFSVTAVDESPQMLERVTGARTVCSSIESLDLGSRFDVVLLASFLVHAAGPQVRRRLLETCRRHVEDDGCVLIQREAQGRHENLPQERSVPGGLVRVVSSEPAGPGVRSVHVEYVFPDARWTQTFLSCPLSDEAFESALTQAGLAVDTFLTEDRTWVRALPVTS
ncbi:class I SAM-dependent methyltransferase [Streptomyces sp. NBC_01619]|uniref:class I SAM-dependent methyltransferase n=1 Tax=unclassified Streptomyces TaxID=2593676 RepID=UPI0022566BCE|nr:MULTISPECIES: class I SAM-dependent methyltransferase [unclassified Streptomyces]MCX4514207.1 class I SAM-dependent methyltransferase [Streptomyces sp. NBC_01619]